MGVTVGEVQAVLSARDAMSAVLESARTNVGKLDESLRTLQSTQDGFSKSKTGLWMPSDSDAVKTGSEATKALGTELKGAGTEAGFAKDILGQLKGEVAAYASVGFLLGAIDATIHFAAETKNMSSQLGISIRDVQELNLVSEDYGATAGELARTVGELSHRIAGDDTSATSAVQMLGLSVDDLKAQNPKELLLSIADALKNVGDAKLKADLARDLGGKTMAEMLPAINSGLRDQIKNLSEVNIMSDFNVVTAAKFDSTLQHLGSAGKVALGGLINYLQDMATGFVPGTAAITDSTNAMVAEGRAAQADAAAHDVLTRAKMAVQLVAGLEQQAMKPITAEQEQQLRQLQELGALNVQNAEHIGVTVAQLQTYTQHLSAVKIALAGWGEAAKGAAMASGEGFKQQAALAEANHALQIRIIQDDITSEEEKNARLLSEKKRYATDLLSIELASAAALRDLRERTTRDILSSETATEDQEMALALAHARTMSATVEDYEARKQMIHEAFAVRHLADLERESLEEENLERAKAAREAINAEANEAAQNEITRKYNEERRAFKVAQEAALNKQIEDLEAAHLAKMAAMDRTSALQGPRDSSLGIASDAERKATTDHNTTVDSIMTAMASAVAQGLEADAKRLQTQLDEENARFIAVIQNLRGGLDEFGHTLGSSGSAAGTGLDAVATGSKSAVDALQVASGAATKAADAWTVASGHLARDRYESMSGTTDQLADAVRQRILSAGPGISGGVWNLPSYDVGGPIHQDGPIMAHAGEVVVPKNGMLMSGGGGGGVTVNVSTSGILLSSDPRAMQQLAATISDVVSRSVKANRKLGTN